MDDEIDFSLIGVIKFVTPSSRPDEPPPPLPYRHHHRGPWSTTPAEEWHHEYPTFENGADRARYLVRVLGRQALAMIDGATADCAVFPHGDRLVSLNSLLRMVDRDAIDDILDYLDPRVDINKSATSSPRGC